LIGEDVTQHIKAVTNLPLFMPEVSDIDELRLRAEVVMPHHAFTKINEEQAEE
jgi:NAD-dependent DNA ligase